MEQKILLLGNEKLYEISKPVQKEELAGLQPIIDDLHDTLLAFRKKYNAGRAIAAPQIGVQKRILYMFIDEPVVFINPTMHFGEGEMMKVLDDCMSFPNLLVWVQRHRKCRLEYLDLNWEKCTMELEGDLSELLQHEYDHLDGILATMRAMDNKSFVIKDTSAVLDPK